MEQIKKFTHYFFPYKKSILLGIACILCGMIFGLLIPYLVGKAVDDLSLGVTWQKIFFYPVLILSVNLISGFFLFFQRRLLIDTSRYIEYDMRRDYYAALVNQQMEFFHNNRVGDLMARATNDLGAIRQIVGPMILYSFQAIFAFCICIPIMMSISVKLTLLLFIPMPLVSLTVKFLGEQVHVRFEKIQDYFSGITAMAQENLSGVRVIRAYAQEDAEISKFQLLNHEYANQTLSLVKYSAAMRPLLFFFIGLGFVIIVAIGVPMAVRGEITAGNFTSFILYLQRMIWYLIALGYVVNLYQRGTASLKRFNAILEAKPTIIDAANISVQPPIRGEIEFRQLNFSYGKEPVLGNIHLKINQGETVAFIGKTGSGKSTLISLIPRLIDAPENTVMIDGISVKDYPIRQLREAIGFVPQETFLFSDTIAENIAFGAEKNSHLSIEESAEIACLSGDIDGFPNKFQQLVGERGISLSGGQKQRTAIARAIMRDPKILILDDSLSAVDTQTEEKILQGLKNVRKNRTTLIVSHRVSTVRDADLICVFENGEIIERGTHDQLILLNGLYANIYSRQLLEDELELTD